ncbi:MAG: hypothetical protein IKI18_01175 [Prevotella sp.]|nr:hypothetical protein [Prevotella sp.]
MAKIVIFADIQAKMMQVCSKNSIFLIFYEKNPRKILPFSGIVVPLHPLSPFFRLSCRLYAARAFSFFDAFYIDRRSSTRSLFPAGLVPAGWVFFFSNSRQCHYVMAFDMFG